MKKQTGKFEGIMKKAVKHMVDAELYGWPPQCSTFLYQPLRPKKTKEIAELQSTVLAKHTDEKNKSTI